MGKKHAVMIDGEVVGTIGKVWADDEGIHAEIDMINPFVVEPYTYTEKREI